MKDIEIFEQKIQSGVKVGKIAIIRGGLGTENPTALLNDAVSSYVGSDGHNQFIEIHLDNPWIRVIIGGINEFEYKAFRHQKLNEKGRQY